MTLGPFHLARCPLGSIVWTIFWEQMKYYLPWEGSNKTNLYGRKSNTWKNISTSENFIHVKVNCILRY